MKNIPLPSGTVLGKYTLVRKISNGGMGMVYLARTTTGVPVVIKEYLPQHLVLRKQGERVVISNPHERRLFEMGMNDFFRENEVLSKIKHDNVVQVIDCFTSNQTAYSVMNYVYGQSLQQIIQENKKTGVKETFIKKVFLDVFDGVEWLHKNRILHLDIKPGNIYVTHHGQALLLDFGTAWLLDFDSPEKKKRLPMHTPGFAPPEQHKPYYVPSRIGTQTDVYALGCSLYSCLKGSPPPTAIDRIDGGETLMAQKHWLGEYSPWLLKCVDDMTDLEWDRRISSVGDIKKIFEQNKAYDCSNPVRDQLAELSQKHSTT
jgi:eukaryotic-like serine/threonine-protein kinase